MVIPRLRSVIGELINGFRYWGGGSPPLAAIRRVKNLYPKRNQYSKASRKLSLVVEFTQIPEQHIAQFAFLDAMRSKNPIVIQGFRAGLATETKAASVAHQMSFIFSGLILPGKGKLARILGLKTLIVPHLNPHSDKASELSTQFFAKNPSLRDLERFSIEDFLVGDLIYDAFLRMSKVSTIDLGQKKFRDFFERALAYTLFWQEFFRQHQTYGFIGSNVYLQGIPQRVAAAAGVKTFDVQGNRIHKVEVHKPLFSEFSNLREVYNQIEKSKSGRATNAAEIEEVLSGIAKHAAHLDGTYLQRPPKLIHFPAGSVVAFVPSLSDSPHTFGIQAFPDPIVWFDFLLQFTSKQSIPFFYKAHPVSPMDIQTLRKLASDFPKAVELQTHIQSSAFLDAGPAVVASIRGHVALEAGLRGIPVVLAGINNPYRSFNFALCAEDEEEYGSNIMRLLESPPKKTKVIENAKLALTAIDACFPDDILIPDYRKNVSVPKSLGQSWKIYTNFLDSMPLKKLQHNRELVLRFLGSQSRRLSPIIWEDKLSK